MFGKLLKYELKSVGKWYLTLNAAVLLVSIILGLVLKALGGNFSTDTNSTSAQIFTIILVLLLAMVISGSLLSTLAIIIKRFYSNIFGRQGYLTLTLPVTTNQIICSKLLASLLWSIFNIFIVIIGIILVILPLVGIGQFVVAFPEIYKIIFIFERSTFYRLFLSIVRCRDITDLSLYRCRAIIYKQTCIDGNCFLFWNITLNYFLNINNR